MRSRSSDTGSQTSQGATAIHHGPWWDGSQWGQYTGTKDTSELEKATMGISGGVKVHRLGSKKKVAKVAKGNKGPVVGDKPPDPNRCFQ